MFGKQEHCKMFIIYLLLAFSVQGMDGATVFFTDPSTIPTTTTATTTTTTTTTTPTTTATTTTATTTTAATTATTATLPPNTTLVTFQNEMATSSEVETVSNLLTSTPSDDHSFGSTSTPRGTNTTSSEPVTVVTMKGLRCIDKNDASFNPGYCQFSANQMVVTREIDGNGFDFIHPGAFDGLDIRVLNLSGLSLKNLDSSSFKGLTNLNTLYLDNNEINDLPQDLFADQQQLSYLYISSNQIKQLKAGLLANKRSLRELSLSNNTISSIEDGTFESQEYLEKLHLDRNSLSDVNKNTFKGLKELQQLNLASNQIRNLPTDVFEYLNWLQTLNLTRNFLKFVPDGVFTNLIYSFSTLDLSFNQIEDIGEKTFDDKRRLSEIYLNDNRLTEIKRKTFSGLDGVVSIYFQNNRISGLRSDSLSGLTFLKKLVLSNNSISSLPVGWLDASGNLEVIDLSHNIIDKVDAGPFKTAIRLKELDFSFNKIKLIGNDWFDTNGALEKLNFRGNSLTSLPNEIFSVAKQIKTLDFGSNRFKQEALKDMFLNLTALKVLRLDNNNMSAFNADDARCQAQLEELYLNMSCLEGVRVVGFVNLKRLDLQNNYLQSLGSNEISNLINLQYLDVSDNNITSFDFKSFESYQQLKLLNISMNLLTNVDSSSLIPTSSNQAVFDFSWNSLTDLSTFPNIYKFYVASEQLQCSCNQLPQWKSSESFVDYRQTVCSNGTNLHFLACYLTNPTHCQVRSELNSTYFNDWCTKVTTSIDLKERPIIYKESCKYPKSEIVNFNLINTTNGFEVTWNVTNINSLKWFTITWKQESQNSSDNNSTDVFEQIFWPKTSDTQFSTAISQSGMTTVCVSTVPVYISIPKSEQCGEFNFTAPISTTSSNKGVPPFWAWIILALCILLLLLFLIILIAVCIRRSKNKRLEKERLEEERKRSEIPRAPSFVMTPLDPDLPQDSAEQAVVSLDMYQNGAS